MLKVLIVTALGAAVGLGTAWSVHQSRYGKVAEFGPFTSANQLQATEVAAALKSKVQVGSPKIEVIGGEEFDFGVMEPGSKGEHSFAVKNVGEYPLTLDIVGSTCKCTIGKLEKSTVEPGEQTEIKLTWDVKSDGEEFGQSAILKTNDPARGELQLKVKGKVIAQMTMVPRSFSFGEVEAGETINLESVIYSFQTAKIEPQELKFSDELMTKLSNFKVEEIPVASTNDPDYASAKQAFKVTCSISAGLPQGAIQQNFIFIYQQTPADPADKTELMSYLTPVAGRIVGAISMVESSKCQKLDEGYVFSLGRVDPATAKPERANIMIRGKYKDTVKLSLGDVQPEGLLRAELGEPLGRGAVLLYPLQLWLDPEAKSGERSGKNDDDFGVVWINTDNPEVPPLRLRVRFAVAKP